MKNKGYIRTDLAVEEQISSRSGVEFKEYLKDGFSVHETRVLSAEKSKTGLAKGRYITVTVGPLWLYDRKNAERASLVVSELLSELISPFVKNAPVSLLAVCLGNRKITSDAIGPLCADRLIVTRHLKTEKTDLFASLGGKELSVITPGVTGETGIETLELILSAIRTVKPSVVVCIDALAARHVNRLATTVQLSDTGISPGSGIGNHRKEISLSTLGIPVISIGVPTVVQSATLVWDALEKAGITSPDEALIEVLENEKSFFVTPKNTDVAVASQAELVAKAINKSFLGFSEL